MKTVKTTVLCDACNKDISYAGGQDNFIVELRSIHQPVRPGQNSQTAGMVVPQISQPLHFCGTACMKKYVIESM